MGDTTPFLESGLAIDAKPLRLASYISLELTTLARPFQPVKLLSPVFRSELGCFTRLESSEPLKFYKSELRTGPVRDTTWLKLA